MQAILLAAGRGQRLAPITDKLPKPLIHVAGKTLIDHQLEKLAKAGISKVVINTGWLGQQLIEHVGNGKRYKFRVVYSIEPEEALETAGGIIQALPLLDDEPFIVCNADVVHEFDFSKLSSISMESCEAHLVLIKNPEHHPDGDFALSDTYITRKDAEQNQPAYTYSGIGLYHKSFFANLSAGRRKLGDLLRSKIDAGKISGQYFSGIWFDAGTQGRIETIEQYLSAKKTS